MSGPPNASPGDLSWNSASLISSWIVGPLYGINICVFILCVHVLHMKGLKGPNLMMLIVASVQFVLATGHISTLLVQLIKTYVGAAGTLDRPSEDWFGGASPEHVAQEALYITNSLIGDAILIWRLWIIWNRNFWLCLPFIVLCIATTVTGYTAVAHIAQLSANGSIFVARVHNWLVATWALSIATQFGATLLISYQVWISIQWNPMGTQGTQASRRAVLGTLVESGALYTVTTIFCLGFSGTNIAPIFAAALGQISALAPTLIIARTGLKSLGSSSSFTPAKGSINDAYHSPIRHLPQDLESQSRECEAMVVHIRKATEICLDKLASRDCGGSSSDERSS
ncbi:hypothetical protein BJV78DRAFT_898274 [Lactifluus subvellereus]|nr:hypothetical protein BJV78DRAFT_898274 [Lactifluus subvellereus]